jgi:hypothetical protein
MTEGSTQAITTVVHHPGIRKTQRFNFPAPF